MPACSSFNLSSDLSNFVKVDFGAIFKKHLKMFLFKFYFYCLFVYSLLCCDFLYSVLRFIYVERYIKDKLLLLLLLFCSVSCRAFGVTVHILEPGFFQTNIVARDSTMTSVTNAWNRLPKEEKAVYGPKYLDKCKYHF